jgi:hypothetical protein
MNATRKPAGSKVERLRRAFMASWSADTSSLWTPENPACGQCSVTALVARDFLGGELLKTSIDGQWHFYNRIDRSTVDFTAGQFARPLVYSDLPATEAEAFADTNPRQLEILRASVSQALSLQRT